MRCLLPTSEIGMSSFFSIDQIGNIIVADWGQKKIKVFSNEGELIHTINSDILPGDQKFYNPRGLAINKKNEIIVADENQEYNVLAF